MTPAKCCSVGLLLTTHYPPPPPPKKKKKKNISNANLAKSSFPAFFLSQMSNRSKIFKVTPFGSGIRIPKPLLGIISLVTVSFIPLGGRIFFHKYNKLYLKIDKNTVFSSLTSRSWRLIVSTRQRSANHTWRCMTKRRRLIRQRAYRGKVNES